MFDWLLRGSDDDGSILLQLKGRRTGGFFAFAETAAHLHGLNITSQNSYENLLLGIKQQQGQCKPEKWGRVRELNPVSPMLTRQAFHAPGHHHMFPSCADCRHLGDYNTTGKWPAVEQDQPANAEVPVWGASSTTSC